MGTFIVSITILVFAVLQVILFFKIWGMTNDVAEMRNILEKRLSKPETNAVSDVVENVDVAADSAAVASAGAVPSQERDEDSGVNYTVLLICLLLFIILIAFIVFATLN